MMASKIPYKLLTTKSVFFISVIVVIITIAGVWFWGKGHQKNLYEDSIISTSILSTVFFLFISIGLYNGVKLKDNLGKIVDKFDKKDIPDFSDVIGSGSVFDGADGIAGFLVALLLWIVVGIVLSLLLWLLSAIIWILILILAAMLYWIFFRALRLIFKNSFKCKDNYMMSIKYGLLYTFLYTVWVYGIIAFTYYLRKIK